MVSGTISPPYLGYFSPFPHGTCPLSVSQEYLALPDGAGSFKRGFTGPVLLRIPTVIICLRVPDYHRLWCNFPEVFHFTLYHLCRSYNPTVALTTMVWAVPRSLATTCGITLVFSSSGYLDVSVHRVCPTPLAWYHAFSMVGCPIRKSADHIVIANPRSLSQLIASFIASESQGIPHTPFLTFFCIENILLLENLN
jgi:hypothetical protein